MIVDTSYLFDLIAGDRGAFRKGTELVDRGAMQWLPTPVVAEVYYGVVTERSDTTKRDIKNGLAGYPRVELDEEIARCAARLLASADDERGGDAGVEQTDAYIAATADLSDDAVLTANVADFRRLGVPVERY